MGWARPVAVVVVVVAKVMVAVAVLVVLVVLVVYPSKGTETGGRACWQVCEHPGQLRE